MNAEELAAAEAALAREKYAALFAQNNDFIGWIKIDGTNVNYPVMQTPNKPDFYLKRSFDKTYSDCGVPYIDEACMTGISNNLVIYGHHMNDGSMFSTLTKYKSKEFWESHKYITFDTLTDKQNYEVIAAFKTVVYTDNADSFKYYQFVNAETAEEFNAYIGKCKELSLYDTGLNAEYGDKLITLSTCEYSRTNGRFVVVARLVKE